MVLVASLSFACVVSRVQDTWTKGREDVERETSGDGSGTSVR